MKSHYMYLNYVIPLVDFDLACAVWDLACLCMIQVMAHRSYQRRSSPKVKKGPEDSTTNRQGVLILGIQ